MMTKICNAVLSVIVAAMAVLALALLGPHLFGVQTYAVLSGSMEPEISVGGLICVLPTKAEAIKVNDIITFSLAADSRTMATHRVISVNTDKREYITKGDANDVADGPVSFDHVVGRVLFSLPFLGYLTIALKTKMGILVAAGVLIVLVILAFLPEILKKEEQAESQS